jgi:hypothetical protein
LIFKLLQPDFKNRYCSHIRDGNLGHLGVRSWYFGSSGQIPELDDYQLLFVSKRVHNHGA